MKNILNKIIPACKYDYWDGGHYKLCIRNYLRKLLRLEIIDSLKK